MKKRMCIGYGTFAATVAGVLIAMASAAWAQGKFDELKVIIEINATDGDAGFQAKGDAEGWKEVRIYNPDGRKQFDVKAFGGLREQGLTEIFFESEEPSCDELPLLEFLERFPAGEYLWTGKTENGGKLEGEAILTHLLPAAPDITAPAEGSILDSSQPVVISWQEGEGLGECDPGDAFDLKEPEALFGFQVIVEREEPAPLMVLSVDLPSDAASLTIPPEFLEEGAIYKFEVLAIEARGSEDEVERGNQTISESFFCTTGIEGDCELPE